MSDLKSTLKNVEKFKLPILLLAAGLIVMLLPTKITTPQESVQGEPDLATLLAYTQGVGETKVIRSESGVVVVCRGADDPKVRLEIIQAVCSYTGLGSDRIVVLKMADYSLGGECQE